MHIARPTPSRVHPLLRSPSPAPQPAPDSSPESSTQDLVSTSLSLVGGTVGLVGGLTHNPLLVAAGAGAFALGSGLEARRVSQSGSLDGQFILNAGLGGSMLMGGLALLLMGTPTPAQTPLQEFLQQHPAWGRLAGNLG